MRQICKNQQCGIISGLACIAMVILTTTRYLSSYSHRSTSGQNPSAMNCAIHSWKRKSSRCVQGNLLDDTELIDVLATTKQASQDVAEKLANASETNAKITEACEEYRPVAHRATLVYFLIAEFAVVNCMYQTSLAQFTGLYEVAIDRSDKATMPSKRIQNIIDYLTYEIYLYIQRGLFVRHKLIFVLMMANKVLQSAGAIKAADIDIFLKGGGALDITSVRKKPKDWIPDNVWLCTIALSQMDSFRDIPDSVFRNDGLWKQWYAPKAQCKAVHTRGLRFEDWPPHEQHILDFKRKAAPVQVTECRSNSSPL
jgi:hypothetical protein